MLDYLVGNWAEVSKPEVGNEPTRPFDQRCAQTRAMRDGRETKQGPDVTSNWGIDAIPRRISAKKPWDNGRVTSAQMPLEAETGLIAAHGE